MATFQENQDKLKELFSIYTKQLNSYNEEYAQNTQGKSNSVLGDWILPYNGQKVDPGIFVDWLAASDVSLSIKKKLAEDAYKNYEDFKLNLDTEAKNLLASTNPDLYVDYIKNKDTVIANAEAEKIKAQADASTKLFAQKNTQYIIIGVVIVAVGLTAFILYKKFSK